MAELRVTELDFFKIKDNLKAFLASQDELSDYNFDGSALSVMLDVLAYNTHYNAVFAHLLANEMFIDTAIKRSSVVSIAKTLGYTPRSATSARARVTVTVVPTGSQTQMALTPSNKFTASINGRAFTFTPTKTYLTNKVGGVFTFTGVELMEGTFLQNSFRVRSDTRSGPFIIPVDTVDVSTMVVDVLSGINTKTYARQTTIVDVSNTDTVYWVEENPDGQYQVVFGDDVIGKRLDVDNVVLASYLACSGDLPNGASTFTFVGTLGGETNVSVTTENRAASGSLKESIDEIRFNAPKFNATRNRAVTEQDYKSLILSQFSRAKSVSVWGGDKNNPPIYGKVFITLDPKDGEVITETDKDFITNSILRPRSVMSIIHEFVDPAYVYVGFGIEVKYNPRVTNLASNDIELLLMSSINTYFTQTLRTLDRTFIYSQFIDYLQTSLPAGVILGIQARMKVQRRLDIAEGVSSSSSIQFLTRIAPESVKSAQFVSMVRGVPYTCYLQDFCDNRVVDPTGTGTLKLVQAGTELIIHENMGTVSYQEGVVELRDLVVSEFIGESQQLRINVTPQDLSKDISPAFLSTTTDTSEAVAPLPSRNSILELDDTEPDAVSNTLAGVTIKATPHILT